MTAARHIFSRILAPARILGALCAPLFSRMPTLRGISAPAISIPAPATSIPAPALARRPGAALSAPALTRALPALAFLLPALFIACSNGEPTSPYEHPELDYIPLDDQYSFFEVKIPTRWVGKTIGALDIRRTNGINIMALKRNGRLDMNISAATVLPDDCTMLVLGKTNELLRSFGN